MSVPTDRAQRKQGEKIEAIQALRGVAAFLVVALHATVFERQYSGGDTLLPDWFVFGAFGVDLFFVISGYVMVTVTRGRFGKIRESTRFLWSRASRIYPTYWFYFFVMLAVFMLRPSWVITSPYGQANLLTSFLLLPNDSSLSLVGVSWTLVHELWFYLVFAVLLLFPQKILLPALCAWAAAVLAINLSTDTSAFAPTARLASHPFTCEFIIGSLAALLVRPESVAKLPSRAFWALASAAVIGLVLASAAGVLVHSLLERALVVGTLFSTLLASCVILEARRALRIPAFLRLGGDMSYTVYLSHVLVLSVIGKLWWAIGPRPGLVDNVFVCAVMFTAVIVYGWVGYRLVEKPLLDLSHRLRARLIG